MKNFKKTITLHLRPTKKDYYLLEFEMRNYISDGKILRFPAYHNNNKLKLQKKQLSKGLIVNHSDSSRLNYYFNNEKIKIEYVFQYLTYNKIELTTKAIKYYLYDRYRDVEHYFLEVEDLEDHIQYNNKFYLDSMSEEQINKVSTSKELIFQNEAEETRVTNEVNKSLENDKIKKLEETDLQYIFENNLYSHESKNNQYNRVANVISYYKKVNNIDFIHYRDYSYDLIDKLIRFAINTGYQRGDKKDFYKVSVIKKLAVFFVQFGKWLTANGYDINSNYRDFQLIIGKKENAHIKYKFGDKYNIVVLQSEEFQKIKDYNFADIKDKEKRARLEQTRDLFVMQVYFGGLRLSDLKQLNANSFQKDSEGNYYYTLIQQKTGGIIENFIPENAIPLLKKYNFTPPTFKADQNYNEQLKAMAEHIKLNRMVTLYEDYANLNSPKPYQVKLYTIFSSKLARKALVSILYNTLNDNGTRKYSVQDIAEITGHSSDSIKYYIKVANETKINMMKEL